jgi:hypothetical protein
MSVDQLLTESVTPAPTETWDEVYRSDPNALPTQSPQWAGAIVATGKFRNVSRLYTFMDGRRAVVPLFEAEGGMNLRTWWSPPAAWGFGGAVATHALGGTGLGAILADLARHGPLQVRVRPNPLDAALWQSASSGWTKLPRTAHVLDLTTGFADVWSRKFRPRTRTTIRKAEQAGLEIESGSGPRLVEDFHSLLRRSVDRWAGHQHEFLALARWRAGRRDPIEKFHLLARAMGPALRFWVARYQGEPAAAILVLQHHNAHYTRGAMNEALAGPTSANYLLHHMAIEAACAAGCRSYHMGETGQSDALAQFKSRFGAVATPYAELLYERVPLHWLDTRARSVVKRLIGFRDV